MSYNSMSPIGRGAVMTWLLALVMMWCFIIIRSLRQRREWKIIAVNGIFGFGSYFVLQMLDYDEEYIFGLRVNGILYDAPVSLVISIVFLLTVLAALLLRENGRWSDRNIRPMSVKEGADSVPSGICVYTEDGLTLLVNQKMHELSRRIFGRNIINGKQFWERFTSAMVTENVRIRRFLTLYAAILPDGTVWMFTRKKLRLTDEEVFQITAVDVTEDYGYLHQVREDTFRLRKMNHRLRKYGDRVDEVIRTEENLAARVRIHNDMGKILLAVKGFMQNAPGIDAEELLRLWKMNLSLMNGNAQFTDEEYDPMDSIREAASFLGVSVTVNGEIPRSEKYRNVFFAAAREALTNAVRHGNAKNLTITTQRQGKYDRAVFTNDGTPPDENMTEGSGLGNLRRMAENAGCRMIIEKSPAFTLIIENTGEREE